MSTRASATTTDRSPSVVASRVAPDARSAPQRRSYARALAGFVAGSDAPRPPPTDSVLYFLTLSLLLHSPTEWAAWLIVSIYTLYALVGGCFTTWTFKIARDSCSDPDEACEASRTMVLSQNAGLSLAGLFNCVFALSYGSAR